MCLSIDLHTHILPKNWASLKKRYGYGGFIHLEHYRTGCARMMQDEKSFRDIDENCWSPEVRMQECNHHKVDVQVLSTVPVMFSYWAKPAHALDLSMMLNDHIAGVVARYPKRFVGLGTVPMQSPELAIRELERCMKIGLLGIQIGSNINGKNLNDPSVEAVLAAAQDLGAAVFVHPWDMFGADRMKQYWTPWLVGMPAETALAIVSLISGGVLERLPKLRICFAHGGGSFVPTLGRIQHGFDVRPDLCAVDNPYPPTDYMGKFWLDSLVHDPRMLRLLVDVIGEDKVALGTDYPFPLGELEPGKVIREANYSPAITEKLLMHNALAFLNMSESQLR